MDFANTFKEAIHSLATNWVLTQTTWKPGTDAFATEVESVVEQITPIAAADRVYGMRKAQLFLMGGLKAVNNPLVLPADHEMRKAFELEMGDVFAVCEYDQTENKYVPKKNGPKLLTLVILMPPIDSINNNWQIWQKAWFRSQQAI